MGGREAEIELKYVAGVAIQRVRFLLGGSGRTLVAGLRGQESAEFPRRGIMGD